MNVNMVFLHCSTSRELGRKHILGIEGGWMDAQSLQNYIKFLMVLYQNCLHSFAVAHIRAQEINYYQIL